MLTLIIITFAFLLIGFLAGLIILTQVFPIWEVKRLQKKLAKEGYDFGKWKHFRELVDHNVKVIVKPNCETLYSSIFIQPSLGPFCLIIPPVSGYFCITFLNKNTDVLSYITNKDISDMDQTTFNIIFSEKNQSVKENNIYLKSNLCWIIARFGIRANEDVKLIHNLQNNLILNKL